MRAREMMNTFVIHCRPDDSVQEVAKAMRAQQVGMVCVCDDEGHPIGVITDRDISIRVCAEGLSPQDTTAKSVMSLDPAWCPPGTPENEIHALMIERGVGRLLVLDEERQLQGVITLAELWHYESPLSAGPVSRRLSEREFRAHPSRPMPLARPKTVGGESGADQTVVTSAPSLPPSMASSHG